MLDRVIDDVEHAEEDRELDQHRQAGGHRRKMLLVVELLQLLGVTLLVVAVSLLKRLHLWLHSGVGDQALLLLDSQRNHADLEKN